MLIVNSAKTQSLREQVTIARDSLGVPHIFGNTDAAAAYGLAWAHAEDDFRDIQMVMLAGKGMLGRAIGRKGAEADYVAALLRCRDIARARMHELSPSFVAVMNGYVSGLNDYAAAHPREVMVKKAFPANAEDYLTAVSLSLCVISGADRTIADLVGSKVTTLPGFTSGGSNAFAIHPSKTTTGEAFLAINSHQPLEGPVAWYEAHVQSNEGWNAIGGMFPGGLCILAGVNRSLGWAHTVNLMDKIDVYQLKMSKDGKHYRFDGKDEELEVRKVKLKVKGIPITVRKKAYWSRQGAVIKNERGFFAMSLYGNRDVRGMEQWWMMNKANNFSQFRAALEMQALPMFNIVYADKHDTIYYLSGGRMPLRKEGYNWASTLPGDTSATLWNSYHRFEELPQLINPASGYLYNTNHSPFLATSEADNLDPAKYDRNSGYETWHNNRSYRFHELVSKEDKISWEKFREIKYDSRYPSTFQFPVRTDSMFMMDTLKFPDIADVLKHLASWDRNTDTNSVGAAQFLLLYRELKDHPYGVVSTAELATALTKVKAHLVKYFGRTDVTLGELQKHSRGNASIASWGLPDVLTAMHSAMQPDGRFRVMAGESYIELVRFPRKGDPIIESINCYGASAHPDSPHYADQMQMYIGKRTRPMSFDKSTVIGKATQVYKPGDKH